MAKRKIFGFIVISVLFFYWKALFNFFQGDEWFYFSEFLPITHKPFGVLFALKKSLLDSFAVSGGGHLTPIYNILWFYFNKLFGLHYFPYAFASIFLHIFNSYLIYIFAKRLTKSEKIALISTIFFSLTYIHQQAITWVMAFIPTLLSVTFFLSGMILFLEELEKNKKKVNPNKLRLAFILFVSALLTKESTFIVFFLIPVTIYYYTKSYWNIFVKYYLLLLAAYIPYRFAIPLVSLYVDNQIGLSTENTAFQIPLMLFRIVTYPLKILSETFIPQEWILFISENLTSLAYPNYGIEKEVRGINFLTFTQSAGSDMIIYLISVLILVIFFINVYLKRKERTSVSQKALIIGFILLVTSSFPLMLIPFYAPWWGYVTFIDSRHLYIASIGGALLFSYFAVGFSRFIASKRITKGIHLNEKSTLIILLLTWGIINFQLLQSQLSLLSQTARQRKNVTETILHNVDKNQKKKVILVTSNQGYYGFGTIPPFQTNLGQTMMIYYYQMNVLPEAFIHDTFLTSGGIAGQGYTNKSDYGFGYYIDELTLRLDLLGKKFSVNDIYAFSWDGQKNQLTDYTNRFRDKQKKFLEHSVFYEDWNIYDSKDYLFRFQYPKTHTLLETVDHDGSSLIVIKNPYSELHLSIKSRPDNGDLASYISKNETSDSGILVGSEFTFRNIDMIYQPILTTLYSLRGNYPVYFVPYKTNNYYIKVEGYGLEFKRTIDSSGIETYNQLIENVIASIQYYEK